MCSVCLSCFPSLSPSLSVCVSSHICNTNSWLVSFGLSFLALGLGARNYILCKVIIVHRVEMQPIVWLCLARTRQMQQYHFNIRMQLQSDIMNVFIPLNAWIPFSLDSIGIHLLPSTVSIPFPSLFSCGSISNCDCRLFGIHGVSVLLAAMTMSRTVATFTIFQHHNAWRECSPDTNKHSARHLWNNKFHSTENTHSGETKPN